ncbi:MAG: tRNA wybutosine-synthesizing 3 family protein [Nanoarchaeota archaeon]
MKIDPFQLWKKQALSKLDKSTIGSIDEKIKTLCETINSREDMFTLSSCSGRICLNKNANNSKIEKIWLFVSHEKVESEKLWQILENYSEKLKLEFRQDSCILHICVKTNELARNLMNAGKESGFNKTGIIANKSRIIVELICDINLNLPIYDKELLIPKKYLEYIVSISNNNLSQTWERIKKLEEKIKNLKNSIN